jgi:hypothetical protein
MLCGTCCSMARCIGRGCGRLGVAGRGRWGSTLARRLRCSTGGDRGFRLMRGSRGGLRASWSLVRACGCWRLAGGGGERSTLAGRGDSVRSAGAFVGRCARGADTMGRWRIARIVVRRSCCRPRRRRRAASVGCITVLNARGRPRWCRCMWFSAWSMWRRGRAMRTTTAGVRTASGRSSASRSRAWCSTVVARAAVFGSTTRGRVRCSRIRWEFSRIYRAGRRTTRGRRVRAIRVRRVRDDLRRLLPHRAGEAASAMATGTPTASVLMDLHAALYQK